MFHINLDEYFPERFDLGKFLNYEDGTFDPITSDILVNLKDLPQGGTFKIKFDEQRPDRISARIYNSETQYWWIIMFYNSIYDVADLKEGLILKYPMLSELEDFYFSLKQREKTK